MEDIICIHSYNLTLDKIIMTIKVKVKNYSINNCNDNILADIESKLSRYNIYHLNIETKSGNYDKCII